MNDGIGPGQESGPVGVEGVSFILVSGGNAIFMGEGGDRRYCGRSHSLVFPGGGVGIASTQIYGGLRGYCGLDVLFLPDDGHFEFEQAGDILVIHSFILLGDAVVRSVLNFLPFQRLIL